MLVQFKDFIQLKSSVQKQTDSSSAVSEKSKLENKIENEIFNPPEVIPPETYPNSFFRKIYPYNLKHKENDKNYYLRANVSSMVCILLCIMLSIISLNLSASSFFEVFCRILCSIFISGMLHKHRYLWLRYSRD